jgi:hypothetical protein
LTTVPNGRFLVSLKPVAPQFPNQRFLRLSRYEFSVSNNGDATLASCKHDVHAFGESEESWIPRSDNR